MRYIHISLPRSLHSDYTSYKEPDVYPALIMCTLGTTDVPKGAMLTETNVLANVMDIASYFAMNSSDTILIERQLYHCAVLTGEFLTGLTKAKDPILFWNI